MMNILIIEDETAASNRLKSMLHGIDPSITVIAVIDGIEDAVAWLLSHAEPDIIFADIQLSDGICFDIFRQVQPQCAVIFTTAYDEYAIDAFTVNSIDYLLKPIHGEDLKKSLDKYQAMKIVFGSEKKHPIQSLLSQLDRKGKPYKTRFLVKSGQNMKPVTIEEAAYFMIESQLVFLITHANKRYLVEHTLDELEKSLDPDRFFRINRQMIIALPSVAAIYPYFNSRLKIDLIPALDSEILVSRMKVSDFKNWLDR
jgi:two-component system, LytTR family, response regulator LytT